MQIGRKWSLMGPGGISHVEDTMITIELYCDRLRLPVLNSGKTLTSDACPDVLRKHKDDCLGNILGSLMTMLVME